MAPARTLVVRLGAEVNCFVEEEGDSVAGVVVVVGWLVSLNRC